MIDERREYQRLHLSRPIDAWFGDFAVTLLDVSAKGARISSEEEVPSGARALLRFYWRGEEVEITAETVRGELGDFGLLFVEQSDTLRRLIAESATEVLRAQEANALGDRARNIVGDETLTSAAVSLNIPGTFITCTFEPSQRKWKRRPSLVPDQPVDGFTVRSSEEPEQIDLLCRSYEDGDTEARRMIRMLAELSASARS